MDRSTSDYCVVCATGVNNTAKDQIKIKHGKDRGGKGRKRKRSNRMSERADHIRVSREKIVEFLGTNV